MLEKPDQRLRQREQLLQVSRAITAQLDLTSVLDLVIDVAVDLLAGTAGLIAQVSRGCSSMVERQLPKLHTRVRFPSPAPALPAPPFKSPCT